MLLIFLLLAWNNGELKVILLDVKLSSNEEQRKPEYSFTIVFFFDLYPFTFQPSFLVC